jgi:hypothetical protein
MLIRIKKANSSEYWYANKVGQTMEVVGYDDRYALPYDEGEIRYVIDFDDAELVSRDVINLLSNKYSVGKIITTSESLKDLLLYKNSKYGDTGLNPLNILLKNSDPITGLLARAEDKIARMQNSTELRKNDVADLIGYLILICVSKGWTSFDEFKD